MLERDINSICVLRRDSFQEIRQKCRNSGISFMPRSLLASRDGACQHRDPYKIIIQMLRGGLDLLKCLGIDLRFQIAAPGLVIDQNGGDQYSASDRANVHTQLLRDGLGHVFFSAYRSNLLSKPTSAAPLITHKVSHSVKTKMR